MADYRVTFSIEAKGPDDEDFKEIGFGSSGENSSPREAEYEVGSIIDNYLWETTGDMPDPDDIKAAIEAEQDL